ncbi:unnamed protein product [Orchesella dallaii]|uniref:Uncharacterized protein n=1 Tax=Orchesella dallaii TaxID=48710 RepID=A0ABP1Q0C7_9HEXA
MASSDELTKFLLTLPQELDGAVMSLKVLEASDLDLTWANLIMKRDFENYELLFPRFGRRPRYILTDNQPHPNKKQWDLATGVVSDFVNTFQNVQDVYYGNVIVDDAILHEKPKSSQSRLPAESGEDLRNLNPKRVRFDLPEKSKSYPVDTRSGFPQKASNLPVASTSSSSRPTCEQSMSTGAREHKQLKEGINDDGVVMDSVGSRGKPEDARDMHLVTTLALKNFKRNVKNDLVLRVVKELNEVKASGKWLQIAAQIPATAELMQELFPSANK